MPNKADLISKMAIGADLTRAQASAAFDALISGITNALKDGQRVTIAGFGTFSVVRRKVRSGRNPQTGQKVKIAAKKVPRFTAGKQLRQAVSKYGRSANRS